MRQIVDPEVLIILILIFTSLTISVLTMIPILKNWMCNRVKECKGKEYQETLTGCNCVKVDHDLALIVRMADYRTTFLSNSSSWPTHRLLACRDSDVHRSENLDCLRGPMSNFVQRTSKSTYVVSLLIVSGEYVIVLDRKWALGTRRLRIVGKYEREYTVLIFMSNLNQ